MNKVYRDKLLDFEPASERVKRMVAFQTVYAARVRSVSFASVSSRCDLKHPQHW